MPSRESVFAAGEAVNGTSSVIKAIASGRKAAADLDRYLGGGSDIDEKLAPPTEPEKNIGRQEGFASLERCEDAYVSVEERLESFCKVVADPDEKVVEGEAKRCLQCDLRLKITPVKFWSSY